MKTTTDYNIYFYYPKGSKVVEDIYLCGSSKQKAELLLQKHKKVHPDYDIKLFKSITTYEEIKIEK